MQLLAYWVSAILNPLCIDITSHNLFAIADSINPTLLPHEDIHYCRPEWSR